MTAGLTIFILKVAVIAVTLLLAASLVAVWRGHYKLHGRINFVFFALTLGALVGLEVGSRILYPDMFTDYFQQKNAVNELNIHLAFSMPAACLLPLMLYTGLWCYRTWHLRLAWIFLPLWVGTFITGVFFLPHELP